MPSLSKLKSELESEKNKTKQNKTKKPVTYSETSVTKLDVLTFAFSDLCSV